MSRDEQGRLTMARHDMRLIEVMILDPDARRRVVEILEEEGLDYNISDRTENPDNSTLVTFPVPAHAVEPVQDRFADLDVREDMYTIVYNPEAVVSRRFTESDESTHVGALAPGRISRKELHSKAVDMLPEFVIYTILNGIAAVVATAGILLDSVPVLIGSMVIAPLLGPAIATSVATVIDDRRLFSRSIRFQIHGGLVALMAATTFAWIARSTGNLPDAYEVNVLLDVSQHTSPAFLLITVAIAGGIAGAISLSTSGSTELVGVMVAAAIMPPIGTVGAALAWFEPIVILGSSIVVLVNVLSINLAAIVTLWYLGYQPTDWDELKRTRGLLVRRSVVLAGSIVCLSLFLTRLGGGEWAGQMHEVLQALFQTVLPL